MLAKIASILLLVFFSYLLGYKIGASDCYKYLMEELKKHRNDEDL